MHGASEKDSRKDAALPYFSQMAPMLLRQGWSFYPQQMTSARQPGVVDRAMLKWSDLKRRQPTKAEVDSWRAECPTHNVAIICRGFVALDIDVVDARASWDIEQIARRVLGDTPFVRVGQAPKVLLLYRFDGATPKRPMKFADARLGGIEILGEGSSFTAYGYHHRTGGTFTWLRRHEPATHPITDAQIVDDAKLDAFVVALNEDARYRIATPPRASSGPGQPLDRAIVVGDLIKPAGVNAVSGVRIVGGKVVDGREGWINRRVGDWAAFNPNASYESLAAAIEAEAIEHLSLDGWDNRLRGQIAEKLRRTMARVASGEFKTRIVYRGDDGTISTPVSAVSTASDDEDIAALLVPVAQRTPIKVVERITEGAEQKRAERALLKDRAPETSRVRDEVVDGIQTWLDLLWKAVRDEDDEAKAALDTVRLMIAPAGAGKTSAFVRMLRDQIAEKGRLGKPILMMMPSYKNITTVKGYAGVGDDDLEGEAVQIRQAGLRVMTMEGKARKCALGQEIITTLQGAGYSTSTLCESEGQDGETTYCSHYETCPYQMQKRQIEHVDLVLCPTAFLDTKIPAQLKEVAAVVIDERAWTGLVASTTIPIDTFKLPRPLPRTLKHQKAVGIQPEHILRGHDDACKVVLRAAAVKGDPAVALLDTVLGSGKETITGKQLVADAIQVCSNAMDAHRKVTPGMTLMGAKKLVEQPQGSKIAAEWRAWKILQERMLAVEFDRPHLRLAEETGLLGSYTPRARGKSDKRLQWVNGPGGDPSLRLSWRQENNFGKLPTLMLDASGHEEIIAKLWEGRKVETVRVKGAMHQRTIAVIDSTYSNQSLSPAAHKGGSRGGLYAAIRQNKVNQVRSKMGLMFGFGRGIEAFAKPIRAEMNSIYAHTDNVDDMHFGDLRGRDDAKLHSYALCVGRMDMPIQFIDGIVGALTYDDLEPEEPIDRNGNGLDDDGKELRPLMAPLVVKKRDGVDEVILVPKHQGHWASIVQRQYREEEIDQFFGRLRTVFREGEAPLAVMLGTSIPEDCIVDDLVHIDDIAKDSEAFEAIRRARIADPRTTAAVAPDLGAGSLEIVDRVLTPMTKDGLKSRVGKGFAKYVYELIDESLGVTVHKESYVPAFVDDPAAWIINANHGYKRRVDLDAGVKVIEVCGSRTAAKPFPQDVKFEAVVGTLEQRRSRECAARETTMVGAVARGEIKKGSRLIQAASSGDLATEFVPVDVRTILDRRGS